MTWWLRFCRWRARRCRDAMVKWEIRVVRLSPDCQATWGRYRCEMHQGHSGPHASFEGCVNWANPPGIAWTRRQT